ncbi:MAG: DUF1178 family protein, partial [Desulfatirhabdiaceae bacterium]|nr:DUF1178 family protein [Desulfatirhabdiaceae bacterium]
MIVFDLICLQGHKFEGWFDDGNAYEDQKARGLLICPVCNDADISKIPTAFSIKAAHPEKSPALAQKELARLAKTLTEFIDINFDNVGSRFATEALKIHYGVTEPRNIRGTSTQSEEKTLKEEGIEFIKIPVVSDDE